MDLRSSCTRILCARRSRESRDLIGMWSECKLTASGWITIEVIILWCGSGGLQDGLGMAHGSSG